MGPKDEPGAMFFFGRYGMWGEHKTTTVPQSKTCLWVYRERPEQRLSPVGITKNHIMAHFGDYSDEKMAYSFGRGGLPQENQPATQ